MFQTDNLEKTSVFTGAGLPLPSHEHASNVKYMQKARI